MENVARSVLTSQLNLLDKKEGPLEEEPVFLPSLNIEPGSQFHVEHRVKQVFDEPVEVRHYSLRLVSSKLSKLRQKEGEIVGELRMQITESEDTDTTANSNNAVEEEDLGNMLSNLGFRLNDACLLSPGDQTRDHSRSSSPSSPRSGFLSPHGGSRSHSRSRGSPTAPLLPSESGTGQRSGLLSPEGGSRSHSRSHSRNRESPTAPLSPSVSRNGQKLATAAKASKSKSAHDFSILTQELEPVDPLLDGKYLDKLQQQIMKPSIASVVDQLQNKTKDEPGIRTKSASAYKASKAGSKKTKNKMDHEDNEQLMTSKVRTKLASVNNFKEGRKHDQ